MHVFVIARPSYAHSAASLSQRPRRRPRCARSHAAQPVQPLLDTLQALVADMPIMISIFGPDGQIRVVNRAWERTLGWAQAELAALDEDILHICFPDPQEFARAQAFVTEPGSDWVDFIAHAATHLVHTYGAFEEEWWLVQPIGDAY
jgi:PAS domain-containing protein